MEEPFCASQQYPNYDKTSQSAKFFYSNQHHVDNQIPDWQKDLESRVDFSHNVKPLTTTLLWLKQLDLWGRTIQEKEGS